MLIGTRRAWRLNPSKERQNAPDEENGRHRVEPKLAQDRGSEYATDVGNRIDQGNPSRCRGTCKKRRGQGPEDGQHTQHARLSEAQPDQGHDG